MPLGLFFFSILLRDLHNHLEVYAFITCIHTWKSSLFVLCFEPPLGTRRQTFKKPDMSILCIYSDPYNKKGFRCSTQFLSYPIRE